MAVILGMKGQNYKIIGIMVKNNALQLQISEPLH
jgi:hypothetical protein